MPHSGSTFHSTALALFRLGFPLAPPLSRGLTWHAISPASSQEEWPLAAGKDEGSGSLSSPLRGAFHLSLTVLVHYRSLKVFSLGGWSPLLPTNSPGFVVLRIPAMRSLLSCTGLSPAPVAPSNAFQYSTRLFCWSYNPTRSPKETAGLGSSRFARHYHGNLV